MVTIIASLHEKWWEKMKAGEKLLEIRKTRPKEPGPFRVLVYKEEYEGVGCCYQWSCPLQNICPADEEDCEKYGVDFEESEFVLVYGGEEDGTDKD